MLAACSGRDVPARASDGFVETDVRQLRRQLRFQARASCCTARPALVAGMLADSESEAVEEPRRARCRLRHRACADRSSRRMRAGWSASICPTRHARAGARAKNVYDELFKVELTAYLRDYTGAFDVIVSADTLVYFGPLEDVVAAAARRAAARRPADLHGGGTDRGRIRCAGTRLSPHGRYCHAREYVERVLADASLRPEIVPAELRLEAGDPVAGLVVRATKPADAGMNHA